MDLKPLHFIGEPIEVVFDHPPVLEKKPGCPRKFIWRGDTFLIEEIMAEWHEYRRRGKQVLNMRPSHAITAEQHGSWGVGQDFYRVKTTTGRIFDIYFDRAPKGADQRKGGWYLYRELSES
jgi:hypothetical protein